MIDVFQLVAPYDRAAVEALNAYVGVNPRFDRILHLVNGNALFKGLPYVAALWWLGGRERSPGFTIRWLLGVFVALVVARVLQNFGPEHIRPVADQSLSLNVFDPNDHNYFQKLNSFPSDHAVEFAAMSLAIASRHIWLGLIGFAWAVVVILLPRICFGYHYPSDVISGCLIGFGVMALFLYTPMPERVTAAGERALAAAPGAAAALAFLASTQIVSNFGEFRELLNAFKLHP